MTGSELVEIEPGVFRITNLVAVRASNGKHIQYQKKEAKDATPRD